MGATLLAVAASGCGARSAPVERPDRVQTIELGSTQDVSAACARFDVLISEDGRQLELYERRASAVLAGCPEHLLPPFDPEAE